MDLGAAIRAAQASAHARGLVGDQALSAITDQVGVPAVEAKLDPNYHCTIAEGIPVVGTQIVFEGSAKPSALRKTTMPMNLLAPGHIRKIRRPEFAILTKPEFGMLIYLIDCTVYPFAAEFLSRFITSPRMQSKKDTDIAEALPYQAREIFGEDCTDIDVALDDIDRWYTTCTYASYIDEIGATFALLRALRLVGFDSQVVSEVFRTLGAAEGASLKSEAWDINMMSPAVALMTQRTASLGGSANWVDPEVAKYMCPPKNFFGAENIFDQAKFDDYLRKVKEVFGVDEESVAMTASIHWAGREEWNVKKILVGFFERVMVQPYCRETLTHTRRQAIEWARQIACALRPDLVLIVSGESETEPPLFKLCRAPKK